MSEWKALQNLTDAAGAGVREAIKAFHGSPRQEHFDNFDPRYIGTGEGANAYSRGFYFAQREPISDDYRRNLSRRRFFDDYGEYFDFSSPAEEVMSEVSVFHPKQQKVLRLLNDEDWLGYDYPSQALKDVLSPGSYNEVSPELRQAADELGTAYEVAIDYPEEAFLDWDAPVDAQGQGVINALQSLGFENLLPTADASRPGGALGVRGEAAYKKLSSLLAGGDSAASAALAKAGVPGVRYLDAVSRRAGEGTRNYVVFPGAEDRIRILRKYGLAPATLGAEGLLNDGAQSNE